MRDCRQIDSKDGQRGMRPESTDKLWANFYFSHSPTIGILSPRDNNIFTLSGLVLVGSIQNNFCNSILFRNLYSFGGFSAKRTKRSSMEATGPCRNNNKPTNHFIVDLSQQTSEREE